MLKKIILFICLLIFGAGSFYLLKNTDNNKNVVTLQFASWGSESEIKILKPILSEFEKENPNIKVDFMHIPQNYFQKIQLLFASNTSPDVVFMNNQYLPIYANAGVLEDLTNIDFDYDKFYKKSIETLSWNGKIYGVPRDISNLVIFYNKDLFKKYNVKFPQNGWNFEDFLMTAKKLTHNPKEFGISFDEEPLYYMPYMMSEGLVGIPNFDDKISQKGLRFYADLRNKYHVAPRREESASATMAQMFLQGRLAMHLSGRWLVPKYRQEAKFDWDIAEFPKGSAGSVTPMDASGWVISKSSKHKNEAIKLVKFLSSEKNLEKFAQSGLIVPARIEASNSANFLDGKKPKHSKIFLTIIETSKPTPVCVNYRKVLDDLKAKTEYMFAE
ncbi:sugar ABC transporter substrate-binding protein [bacterium]|nr:sugar ABC transporter substrate-binding protein [bacterium]